MTFQSARALTATVAAASVITQGRFVVWDANGNVVQNTVLGAQCDGVALEGSAVDVSLAIPVAVPDSSIIEVEAGAAVTAGDEITSDATGRAITGAAGHHRLGRALQAAGAAGEFIKVLYRNAASIVA